MVELFNVKKLKHSTIKELKQDCIDSNLLMMGHYDLDYPWIINNLPKNINNKKIADIGGGLGVLQYYLVKNGAETYNFDRIDYNSILNNNYPNYHFIQSDLGNEDFFKYTKNAKKYIEYFDFVVSCSALEHNMPSYFYISIGNIKKMLKKGGKLLLSLPFSNKEMTNGKNMLYFNEKIINTMCSDFGFKELSRNNFKNFDKMLIDFKSYYKISENFVEGGVILQKI